MFHIPTADSKSEVIFDTEMSNSKFLFSAYTLWTLNCYSSPARNDEDKRGNDQKCICGQKPSD